VASEKEMANKFVAGMGALLLGWHLKKKRPIMAELKGFNLNNIFLFGSLKVHSTF
jgi:hypothetical protein